VCACVVCVCERERERECVCVCVCVCTCKGSTYTLLRGNVLNVCVNVKTDLCANANCVHMYEA